MTQNNSKAGKQGKRKSGAKTKDLPVAESKGGAAQGGSLGLAATALKTTTTTPILTTSPVNPNPLSKIALNPQPLPPR